ncbi:MAG: translocation/assembly module TamB [Bacteroidaceae bacterium]|nr:translocation/assembly module TamB [Bacteroidaceae bacterium]
MDTPAGRRYLASEVSARLSDFIGARVVVDEATVGLPGHVRLSGLRVYDRADSLMLSSEILEGGVELLTLIQSGRIRLRSIALLDGEAHLYRLRGDTAMNIQFLLDAFKGSDVESRSTDLTVSQLVVRRFAVHYAQMDAPKSTAGRFSAERLSVTGLSASLRLPTITDSLFHADVRSLSFRERSGVVVENLRGEVWLYAGGLRLKDFELRLPNTRLAQHDLRIAYDVRDIVGTLKTSGVLSSARIATDDFAPLLPQFASLHTQAVVSGRFDIAPQRITLRSVNIAADHPALSFDGDLQIDRKSDGGVKAVKLRSDRLAVDVPSIDAALQQVSGTGLPDPLVRLGGADFSGFVEWSEGSGAKMTGRVSTTLGSATLRGGWNGQAVAGSVSVADLRLSELLADGTLPASITAMADGALRFNTGVPTAFEGRVALARMLWNGRQITGVTAEGNVDDRAFSLRLNSLDPAATLTGLLTGEILNGMPHSLLWEGDIAHLEPAVWGLDVPADMRVRLCGRVEVADFASLNSLEGRAALSRLVLKGAGTDFDASDLNLSLSPTEQGHDIQLQTPYGDLAVQGSLDVTRLLNTVKGVACQALPDLVPSDWHTETSDLQQAADTWALSAHLRDDRLFKDLLHIPLSAPAGLDVEGTLSSASGRTDITLRADSLFYQANRFDHVRAYLQGESDEYSLLVQTATPMAGTQADLAALIQTGGRILSTNLSWQTESRVFRGELLAQTRPVENAGRRMLRTVLQPTEVFFKDSVWSVRGGSVIWGEDTLSVSRLLVEHADQHIALDGAFTKGSPDSIMADLQGVNLEYIFDLLNFHPVYFAGISDGHAVLKFSDEKPLVEASLDIRDFSINQGRLGRAGIKGRVDLQRMLVHLDADILDAPYGGTQVSGDISPNTKMLDLDISSQGTNLSFLRRYLGGILHDITGRATGHTRLYGTFQELQLEGDVVADVRGDLPVTGCAYDVDSLHVVMQPGLFDIRSGTARDGLGGTAAVAGRVEHAYLSNFRYNFGFALNRMLLYDRPRTPDITFSSHAVASGTVGIEGGPGFLQCDMDVRPVAGTDFIYHVDLPDDYSGSSLLQIRPADDGRLAADGQESKTKEEVPTPTSDMMMNLTLDMTPDVPLTVIMDEKTGDKITVRGGGQLRASYYNKGTFNLYGTYTVEDGTYKMTIQDIIHKDFRFQQGGRVIFGGKPFDGIMDMQAVYTVPSASLADLNLTGGVSQNGVRVNCLLNFSGQLGDPKVQFDLDMPTVSQDVKQMVRSLISTDEEMNRQVLYLLAIGRFYTYDYASTTAASSGSQTETAMNSFLSSTLSGQLNQFITSAMGQSNWSFGTNVSTGSYGWEDAQVGGQFGGRLLGNRLLINGNFGYRNSVTQQNGNFVGDFDVQYLLTPGGGLRLKAYNETNDRYFTKNSLTTQGAGIVLQRSFNKFRDLFRRK